MDSKLYLKYRPTQLDDFVGQRHVVATLSQASKSDVFAHAYLFAGERGCGKTSMARTLATLMTCENLQDTKVCGKCRPCKTIRTGASLDVQELDGATNRGIDDIKALIDGAQWSPQELSRKIYIIDEAHQLTKEATSALLKTLEEPPSYLTFILCTTEIRKILPTILSRCQRFNFKKLLAKEIADQLKYIAKKEGIDIEEKGIAILSKIARGSMRDAIGYLEQIGTVGINKKLTEDNIQKYFGTVDRSGILDIVKAIKGGNVSLVLDQVNDMIMASSDAKNIMYEISETFRNIMVLKVGSDRSNKLVDLPDNEITDLNKIGSTMEISQLVKLAHLFSDIEKKMDFNINERWIMEATLIKCVASLRNNKS